MKPGNRTLRICRNGHRYYKSSKCPVCPVCEAERRQENGFLARLPAPARRALENRGITTPDELSMFSEKEILELHGMGKSSLSLLKKTLRDLQLTFKPEHL